MLILSALVTVELRVACFLDENLVVHSGLAFYIKRKERQKKKGEKEKDKKKCWLDGFCQSSLRSDLRR